MHLTSPRERAVAAVAEHAPEHRGPWSDLGSGLDHQAFRVGDLVVRVTAPDACAEVTREAELLRLLAGRLPIPVPSPRFADPARGVLAYPLLPGRPLLGRTPPAGVASHLGHVLAELHAINPAGVEPQDQPTGPTAPAGPHGVDPTPVALPVEAADPRDWLVDLTGPAELLRVLHADPPPASTERVLAHADLGAEHLLAARGRLTGLIDWSDAAVTDPALDFARPYRDFGPAFLDEVLRAYGRDSPAFRRRITFFARCAALEDLAYGDPAYTRPAARSLTWLFGGLMP
jgi:aminoglycoside phosphotransferase (APT) family kinase protein